MTLLSSPPTPPAVTPIADPPIVGEGHVIGLPQTWLAAGLVAFVALTNGLFLASLGLVSIGASLVLGLAAGSAIAWAICQRRTRGLAGGGRAPALQPAAFIVLAAISGLVLLLGGEGRVFYANTDWVVRDSVLNDLTRLAWPFAYADHDRLLALRAETGMFLIPALAGKVFGEPAAPWALWLQNSLMLTLVLGLAAALAAPGRRAWAAGLVFVGFSGMDAAGLALKGLMGAHALRAGVWDHIEPWAGTQFSSVVTDLFWAPNHGLTGMACGLLYLGWRRQALPASALLLFTPLTLIWSPLVTLGALPFAAHAGLASLWRRELTAWDLVAGLLAAVLILAPVGYLFAGVSGGGAGPSGGVGFHFGLHTTGVLLIHTPTAADNLRYALTLVVFYALEAGAVLALLLMGRDSRRDRLALLFCAVWLALCPVIHISDHDDFCMRASIPALAVLAAEAARRLVAPSAGWSVRLALAAVLLIGAVTPALEIAAAFRHPPVRSTCGVLESFRRAGTSYATYLTDRATILPALRRPPRQIAPSESDRPCQTGPWFDRLKPWE